MATSGILTYMPSSGKLMLTPDGAGGVFLRVITFDSTQPTQVQRFEFPDAVGMKIFGILIEGGYHEANFQSPPGGVPFSEALGMNANGWYYPPEGGFLTKYAVFGA